MKLRQLFDVVASYFAEAHAMGEDAGMDSEEQDRNLETARALATKALIAHGFEFLGQGEYSNAYRGNFGWGDVVIKVARTWEGVNMPDARDLERYPILRKRLVKPLFRSQYVAVQPLVKGEGYSTEPLYLKRFRLAHKALKNKFWKLCQSDFDGHAGNVGFYKGKMMIFDAMA